MIQFTYTDKTLGVEKIEFSLSTDIGISELVRHFRYLCTTLGYQQNTIEEYIPEPDSDWAYLHELRVEPQVTTDMENSLREQGVRDLLAELQQTGTGVSEETVKNYIKNSEWVKCDR